MSETPRRSFTWLILAGSLLVVLITAGAVGYFREVIRWNRFVDHQEAWRKRVDVGPIARESLVGPTGPGDAMADYENALDYFVTGPKGGLTPRSDFRVLSQAVHKSQCSLGRKFGYVYENEVDPMTLPDSPLELALVKAQSAIDLGEMPRAFGGALVWLHEAIHELHKILQDPATPESTIDLVEKAIAHIDRHFPSMATAMDRTGYLVGEEILRGGSPPIRFRLKPLFFRGDPSFAEFQELWGPYVDLLRRGETMEWIVFEPEYDRYLYHVMAGRGGTYFSGAGDNALVVRSRVDLLIHVRLLHAALLARRGIRPGASEWPVNPFAQKPVIWDDVKKEAVCDRFVPRYPGADPPCWGRGASMVLKLR